MNNLRRSTALAVLVLVLAGCGISKDIYWRDVNNLKKQIADVTNENQRLIQEKRKLESELEALAKEKGSLSKDLREAMRKMEELKAQAAKRKAALEALKDRLRELVAAGKLKVKTEGGLIKVEMAEKVLFDVGRYNLKPEGRAALDELTPVLASLPGRRFQVAGHTDDTGSPEFNWKLSLNRALEVVLYMIEQGMPPERISAAGFGMYQPVASNDTPEGRAQNRRIEVILVPNMEELMGFGEGGE